MIGLFKHLLPRAKTWSITIDKQLREFFEATAGAVDDARTYFEDIWLDLFPATTRELAAWEQQFAVDRSTFSNGERRTQLDGLWTATGGQSPKYIQDTIRAAGYDVYVHEWWVPGSDPPVARDPGAVFGQPLFGCGDSVMECGETVAECGNGWTAVEQLGYALVNKVFDDNGLILTPRIYPLPTNPDYFPYCLYICGQTFGNRAVLPSSQKDGLEDLLLKICPAQQWIIIGVEWDTILTEGWGGPDMIEGVGGDTLTEG